MTTSNIAFLATSIAALLAFAPCQAGTTINLQYITPGNSIPGIGTSQTPDPQYMEPSTGSPAAVANANAAIQAAADYWEAILGTNFTLTIKWGWVNGTDIGNALAASGGTVTLDGKRIKTISLGISRIPTATSKWYADGDINTWAEYPNNGRIKHLGIRYLNTNNFEEITRCTEQTFAFAPRQYDLYTVILHEIGHCLGMKSGLGANTNYAAEAADNFINVTSPRPCFGMNWGVNSQAHLTNPAPVGGDLMNLSLMYPSSEKGRRRWPTMADISCIAQVSPWYVESWNGPTGPATTFLLPPH